MTTQLYPALWRREKSALDLPCCLPCPCSGLVFVSLLVVKAGRLERPQPKSQQLALSGWKCSPEDCVITEEDTADWRRAVTIAYRSLPSSWSCSLSLSLALSRGPRYAPGYSKHEERRSARADSHGRKANPSDVPCGNFVCTGTTSAA